MPTNAGASAWTTYWALSEPGGGCLPSAPPDVARALQDYWRFVAGTLTSGHRLLDLGCGAGAVAHLIAEARPESSSIPMSPWNRIPSPTAASTAR